MRPTLDETNWTPLLAIALIAALYGCASVELDPAYQDAGLSDDEDQADEGGKPGGILLDVGLPGDDAGPGGDNNGGANNTTCPNPTAYYPDFDRDGFGDAAAPVTMACDAFENHVANNQDCDDSDAAVNPNGVELPGDNVDQDCDGSEQCFIDADNDGFRTIDTDTVASIDADCDDPGEALLSDPATDCDDNDPLATPGGVETCNGADDNCDGIVDDGGDCPCPVEVYNNKTYLICSAESSWFNALSTCQGAGYNLVTTNDAQEDQWVYDEINRRGLPDAWIGFNDIDSEGSFVWVSGEPITWTHWDQGEPNDGGDSGEDCAVIMTRDGRRTEWDDRPCDTLRPWVCEAP